jgi:hypothetical protein
VKRCEEDADRPRGRGNLTRLQHRRARTENASSRALPITPQGDYRGTARVRRPGRVAWYWRLLAWALAAPIGFVIAAVPAYWLQLVRKGDVLDVFVGSGLARYGRLAGFVVAWAFVMTVLVQVFVGIASRHGRRRAG